MTWTQRLIVAVAAAALTALPVFAAGDAKSTLDTAGVTGGLVVHLGCGDGKLTAALRADDGFLVQGLDAGEQNVAKAREHIRSQGLYGPVTAEPWAGRALPYIDNLVNLVVSENADAPMDEVLRVLRPGGVALIGGRKTVKPRPADIDEWTHYLHGPDNNAVARDRVVAIPHHIQWVGGPKWARHHNHLSSMSAMVSAGGRMFAIVDEAPVASMVKRAKWALVARDAFNGVVLWKKAIGPWEKMLRPFRSGPTELSRRLVAVGDRVYVTLGYGKAVVALDAATGQTVRTYDRTRGAVEIIHDDGVLYIAVGAAGEQPDGTARRSGSAPSPQSDRLVAIDAETGRPLWSKADGDTRPLMPTTLCAAGGRAFFQSPSDLICLDAKSGREQWRTARAVLRNRRSWSAPTLVAHQDVVLSADCAAPAGETGPVKWTVTPGPKRGDEGAGELIAFSATDGRELWRCPAAQGYTSPVDLFVADGLVWVAANPNASDVDFTVGRDPKTGQVKRRLDTAVAFDAAHHHRCYRNKATDRFILLGRTGVEFIGLGGETPQRHYWIRGGCQYGVLPANGLLTLPPHSCGCYIQSKLSGFWALAPARSSAPDAGPRLNKGPAYGKANPQSTIRNPHSNHWPTYRHDPGRTGRTDSPVPAGVKPAWETEIGGRLSGLVVADQVVLVSAIDAHTIHAMDASSGKQLWRRTVGGWVDSPPTVHEERAIFGSADGFVYCLRLADGELVWRFRAAPADRQTVAFGQLESVWPVTGSVLVREGVVYCTAGRTSYLDGGMVMFRLDAATGEQIGRTSFANRDPKTGRQPNELVEDVELPGALPDVLVDDGRYIYLRDKRMEPDGTEKGPTVAHLYSSAGLLDGSWWHRTYWSWNERNWGRASGWATAAGNRPSGRILVADEKTVFGYGRKRVSGSSGLEGYHLFRADKKVQPTKGTLKNNNAAVVKYLKPAKVTYYWSREVPLVARAMLLAGGTLFAAGPVMKPGDREPTFNTGSPAVLTAFRAEDGGDLASQPIEAQPVFDGLAAAYGRLYMATTAGKVRCFAAR